MKNCISDWQALLDAFPLPVFITDESQVFIAGNSAFEKFTAPEPPANGCKIEKLLETTLPQKTIKDLDRQVLKTGTPRSLNLTVKSIRGQEHHITINKALFQVPSEGQSSYIMNSLEDVTSEHRAQHALVDAIDYIAEAFVMYDSNGHLEICNQNFRDMYQYTKKQTKPGVHFKELGKIDILNGNVAIGDEKGEDYLERKAAYRRELKGSFTVELKDGRWIRTTDRAVPGKGFVSIQSDITAIKNTENTLLKAKETAELASRAKSEFLANMSHELKTPLNCIIGFSEILMSEMFGQHSNPKYKEYSEAINGSSIHLLELISEILDQSKIELGNVALDEEDVHLETILDECKILVKERSSQANIEITIECPENLPTFSLDRLKIKQTVLNLLTNSIKFTDPNGKVQITAGLTANEELEIKVSDDGIGIAPDEIQWVTQPFTQVAESKTRNHDGTGLGLSIAKSFVELHQGELSIDSALGQGTTVCLRFPSKRTKTF
ncbi:ATP-binding protein [uncultured Kiloniella sp.]|uniref:PAS domain-containing sensor histidine kinase n=1 Tax=uncultured Kiloniella sp. TaxID=1133091 RepID=UPI0026225B96|nr:ATP-binding protein [uncultured Kiloniella sp.]